MKINTMLAIALLITGSSLYAEEFRGHRQQKEDKGRRHDEKRHERRDDRRNSRDHEHHKMSY